MCERLFIGTVYSKQTTGNKSIVHLFGIDLLNCDIFTIWKFMHLTKNEWGMFTYAIIKGLPGYIVM